MRVASDSIAVPQRGKKTSRASGNGKDRQAR
jgi:hypothetical protein